MSTYLLSHSLSGEGRIIKLTVCCVYEFLMHFSTLILQVTSAAQEKVTL